MVEYRDLFEEFKNRKINVLKDEQQMILDFIKPNKLGQINYIILLKAILNGKNSVKTEITTSTIEQLTNHIKEEINDTNETVDSFFKRNTGDSSNYLSIKDVKDLL